MIPRIAIIGDGITAHLAAAYFRLHLPNLEVLIIGSGRKGQPIVGESLVEISTCFIRGLGLGDHLIREQFPKYGLTYYYRCNRSETSSGEARYLVSEAPHIPPFPSYQLNRRTFDKALANRCLELGVRRIDGRVTDYRRLATGEYRLDIAGSSSSVDAGWMVDASGRSRFLAKRLGLSRRTEPQRDAFWMRLEGVDPEPIRELHAECVKKPNRGYDSYYATHHFFGGGRWVWLIPLRAPDGGHLTSLGTVSRPDLVPEPIRDENGLRRMLEREHPVLARHLSGANAVDGGAYRGYMYRCSRLFSHEGWFVLGDAGHTVDALYSLGLAITCIEITQAAELIRRLRDGTATAQLATEMSAATTLFHRLATEDIDRLYDVMERPFECALRQQVSFLTSLHVGLGFMFNGWLCDPVWVRVWNRLAGQQINESSDHRSLERLIHQVATRRGRPSADDMAAIQSAQTMNFGAYEHLGRVHVGLALAETSLLMAQLRLRLLRMAGTGARLDLVQWVAWAKALVFGLALRAACSWTPMRRPAVARRVAARWLPPAAPEIAAPPFQI